MWNVAKIMAAVNLYCKRCGELYSKPSGDPEDYIEYNSSTKPVEDYFIPERDDKPFPRNLRECWVRSTIRPIIDAILKEWSNSHQGVDVKINNPTREDVLELVVSRRGMHQTVRVNHDLLANMTDSMIYEWLKETIGACCYEMYSKTAGSIPEIIVEPIYMKG